jgi:hypothetical protein
MSYRSNLILLCLASTGWAGTVAVTGNSGVMGNPLWFDAQSIDVTTGPGTLTLNIFTNFENSGLYAYLDTGVRLDIGDVFITVNGNIEYGIPLEYHNGPAGGPWGDRLLAGHIYEITDPSTALMTAEQVLHDPAYLDYRPDTIVWMMDDGGVEDLTAGTPAVQILPIAGNNGVTGPLYDIQVVTSLPPGLFSSPTDSYGLQWSVVTGGNDIISGPLDFGPPQTQGNTSAAPEPGTVYLMIGAGLVGLSVLSRRRG